MQLTESKSGLTLELEPTELDRQWANETLANGYVGLHQFDAVFVEKGLVYRTCDESNLFCWTGPSIQTLVGDRVWAFMSYESQLECETLASKGSVFFQEV